MKQQTSLLAATLVFGMACVESLPVSANPHDVEEISALSPNLDNGRRIYETCALCHTPLAWGDEGGRYPRLAGQHTSNLIKQLVDIRAGNRDNPTMYPFTQAPVINGPQDIADVSAYIAQLLMPPHNGVGTGHHLELGGQIYRSRCAICHGSDGEGNEEDGYPAVYSQHYRYLERQLHWFKIGKRRNGNKHMYEAIVDLSGRDIDAVADHMSRLRPPADKMAQPEWQNPDFPKDFRFVPPKPTVTP